MRTLITGAGGNLGRAVIPAAGDHWDVVDEQTPRRDLGEMCPGGRRPYDRDVADDWPLVGRDGELARVDRALRDPRTGGVVLAGAAGVGKTRLARAVLAGAGPSQHWVVATASARTVPFGAFRDLGWPLGPPAVAASDGPASLADDLGRVLGDARGERVLLAVDNAELLDDRSAALLLRLATEGAVPLLLTLRTGEPAPDAVTALWKDGYLERVEVLPLSEPDTAALLEGGLGGAVEHHSAHLLHTLSRGNALVLRQLVEGAASDGTLRCFAGVWRWRGEPVLTPVLSELVDARVRRLPAEVLAVLELLSLAEPLDVALLEALTAPRAVEEAEQQGVVTVGEASGRVQARCAHPLYAEALRARTGRLRSRRLRTRLVEALSLADTTSGDVMLRAVLLLDSDAPPAPALFTRAAEQALGLYDVRLAERLARAAVSAGAGWSAASALGHALSWLDRPAEAEAVLAPLDTSAATDDARTRVAIPRAANLFWTAGRADAGERVLADALAAVTDERCRAELLSMSFCLALFRNRPGDVARDAPELVCGLAEEGRPSPWGAAALALALAVTGRADEAVPVARRQLALVERRPDAASHAVTLAFAEQTALGLTGRPVEAAQVASRDHPLALGATWPPHMVATLHGRAALDLGRPAAAATWFREAAAGLAGHDPARWRFVALCWLTHAEGMLGHPRESRLALADAVAEYRDCHALYAPELALAHAWAAAADDGVTAAREHAHDAARAARDSGQCAVEVVALHTAVRFGSRDVADRLRDLADRVHGPRAAVTARHAAALAADDGPALDEVSAALEELGFPLAAADAAAQAAAAHRRGDRTRQGVASAARASRLARACEKASTPALRAAARPLPLTEREREVVGLAAAGLSNRAIADRLHISVRTVEGHVYRACTKVDVADRPGLVALVTTLG